MTAEKKKFVDLARRLPPLFALFMVMLPLVMFLFEFGSDKAPFTNYQLYALAFAAIVFVAANLSGHRGVGLIVLAVCGFLALPATLKFLFWFLLGTGAPLDGDYLYFASNFLAIAAVLLYFRASGVTPKDLFIAKPADASVWKWTILLAAASAAVLIVYFRYAGVESTINFGNGFPAHLTLAIVFAIANGLMEELWFRSLILGALVRAFPPRFSVVYQAVLFGIIHFDGVPAGGVGVALGFIFGAAMGYLTLKAKSFIPAAVVHIAADFTIGLYFN